MIAGNDQMPIRRRRNDQARMPVGWDRLAARPARPSWPQGARPPFRRARALLLVPVLGLLTACVLFGAHPETPAGPGVPRIADLRFDPDVIDAGGTTRMSFYFEVGSADLQEGFLIERGISQFQFYQRLQAMVLNLRVYDGQVAGRAEVPLRWDAEGVRLLELYVVTRRGNASNRLRGTLTVR